MEIPLLAFVLQGIPESISILTLSFAIAKKSFQWKKLIVLGFISAFISYLIRLTPIAFGGHTIILMTLHFLFLIKYGGISVINSLKSCLISFLVLIIIESVFINLIMSTWNLTHGMVINSTSIRIVVTMPQVLILFTLAFLIRYQYLKAINT